ncbi:MAG TPA: hypothetical protein VIG04_07480 [Gemmatimonadales bacterium]|jgi:hypothetical protein
MLLPIVIGTVLGSGLVLLASRSGRVGEIRLLAIGLVVTALLYVVLALPGAGRSSLALETGGLAIFGGLAWLGSRVSPLWLALGWAGHVAWDVGLHLERTQHVVPPWYPLFCVGFDLIVAGYLLGLALPRRAAHDR